MTDYTELKARAEARKGWAMTDCWQSEDFPEDWEVGRVNEEDQRYPVMFIDTADYDQPESAPILARYYAAANPTTILGLIAEVELLRGQAGSAPGVKSGQALNNGPSHREGIRPVASSVSSGLASPLRAARPKP